MKKTSFLSFSFLLCMQTYCQENCSIVTSETSVQYIEQKSGGPLTAIRTVSLKVEYWSTSNSSNADDTLSFTIDTGTAASYKPVIISASPILLGSDFSTEHKTKLFDVSVSIGAVAAFTYATFSINLDTGETKQSRIESVRITKDDESEDAKTKFNGEPYWVELGTNIDLVDGPKPNNFTAGIFFQKFDHSWGGKNKHWASFAGAYEAKIVSTNLNNLQLHQDSFVNNSSFIPGVRDSIKVYNYSGKPMQTQTIRNWSFFYSPAYRLFSNGKDSFNDGNFHLYVSFWAELRYQEIETKTDNSTFVLIDSARVPISTIGNYNQWDDTIIKSSVYSHYFGLGLPLYYETEKASLFLNPVLGVSNQLTGTQYQQLASSKEAENLGNPKWNPFYFVQFRLSENEFGFTITGEIRGLIKKNSPPQYTIALTKKFNLSKLMHYSK